MSKREDIIKGTIEAVAENGIANTPTVKIADQSGAAEYTLFRLFGNKENLLHETYSELIEQFRQACEESIMGIQNFEQKFKKILAFIIKYYRERPEELSYLQQYISSPLGMSKRPDIGFEEGKDISMHPALALLAQGRSQGLLKQLSMPVLASISLETIIMFLREEQIRNIEHSQKEVNLTIEACWQGVKI